MADGRGQKPITPINIKLIGVDDGLSSKTMTGNTWLRFNNKKKHNKNNLNIVKFMD
jgi:hypothetical protein